MFCLGFDILFSSEGFLLRKVEFLGILWIFVFSYFYRTLGCSGRWVWGGFFLVGFGGGNEILVGRGCVVEFDRSVFLGGRGLVVFLEIYRIFGIGSVVEG